MRQSRGWMVGEALIAAALVVGAGAAKAQAARDGEASAAGAITVTGQGAVRAPNDMATLSVAARVRDRLASTAFARAGEAAGAILDAARRAEIDALDMTTQSVSLAPIHDREGGRQAAVTAYEAQQRLEIVVRAVDGVGPLIDSLAAVDDVVVETVRFEVADPQAHRDAARIAAVRDAYRIAGQIAAEAGVALGAPISITEGRGAAPAPRMAQAAMDSMPVAAGGDIIGASVTIVFAMNP